MKPTYPNLWLLVKALKACFFVVPDGVMWDRDASDRIIAVLNATSSPDAVQTVLLFVEDYATELFEKHS
jgi:hypothetical protein